MAVSKALSDVKEGDFNSLEAPCPAGKKVLGGGYTAPDPRAFATPSLMTFDGSAWSVTFVNTADADLEFVFVAAICATVLP